METTTRRPRGTSRPGREPSPQLADMIRDRLAEMEISRAELARRAGLSQGYVSKLVAGTEVPPSEPMMRELAKILDLDADEMLFAAGMLPGDMELQILSIHPGLVRDALAILKDPGKGRVR